ncbi:MAG: universal stress protein [Candidatus Micrarchaeia archaeon]|jgi:nucleotide-binding universal stress UspA family protein
MFERILVALDGSKASQRALNAGLAIAKKFKSRVFFAGVVLFADDADVHPAFVAERALFAKAVKAALARARKAGLRAEGVVLDGAAEEALVGFAREKKCGLIVLGHWSGHASAFKHLVLGSVSKAAVDASGVDVLVVK